MNSKDMAMLVLIFVVFGAIAIVALVPQTVSREGTVVLGITVPFRVSKRETCTKSGEVTGHYILLHAESKLAPTFLVYLSIPTAPLCRPYQ